MKNLSEKIKVPYPGKVVVTFIETPAMALNEKKKQKKKIIAPNQRKQVQESLANDLMEFAKEVKDHPMIVRIEKAHKDSGFNDGDIGLLSHRHAAPLLESVNSRFPTNCDMILVDNQKFYVIFEDNIVAVNNDLKERIKGNKLTKK